MAAAHPSPLEDDRGAYTGWLIGGLIIVAVLSVMSGLWFYFHGL